MPERVSFWLPVPPSANNLTLNAGKRRIKTDAYKAWLNAAGWRIKEQRVEPVPGKTWGLALAIPINRTRDTSNCLKPTEDLIVKMGLIKDDRWIDDTRLVRVEQGTEMHVALWAIS